MKYTELKSWARNIRSGAAIKDATDVSLSSEIATLPIGASTMRMAWGNTTQRNTLRWGMPIAFAASTWPLGTACSPER
ncbi:hypothetical protein D3C76_1635480 [compost metagenome]